MTLEQVIPYILPLLVLQLALQIYATINLFKEDTVVRFNNKWIWAVVIWLFQIPGALIYLLLGKSEQ